MNFIHSLYTTLFRAYERHDYTRWEVPAANALPIDGYYHVFCAPGWQQLVAAQVARLQQSGLAAATRALYVSVVWHRADDLGRLQQLLAPLPATIVAATQDALVYEFPALECLLAKSREDDCLVYYFHTKGVSFFGGGMHSRRFRRFKRNVNAWRELMEYYLMDKWQVAVNCLNDGFDTYGCNRCPPPPAPYAMYGGNFWWAHARYLRRLPDFTPARRADRLYAERWLYLAGPRDFCTWDTLANLYRVCLPESLYKQSHARVVDSLRFVVRFNITKLMKKVFHYNYIKRNNDSYQKNVW